MKKSILILVWLLMAGCKETTSIGTNSTIGKPRIVVDTVETIKIVKSVKEEHETSTSYHYRYDLLNDKFRHQPKIESSTKYYIVFTDGTIEQTTKENGMFYDRGDTIRRYSYIYK